MFFRRWRRRPHHDRSRNGSGLTGHHQSPDGVVHPYSGLIDSITFDPITRSAVVVASDPVRCWSFLRTVWPARPRLCSRSKQPWIPTYATFRSALTVSALLSMDRQVVKLNLTSGEQTSIPVDGQANSAVELNDGRIAIGTDNGSVHIVDPKNDQSQTVSDSHRSTNSRSRRQPERPRSPSDLADGDQPRRRQTRRRSPRR